MNDLSQNHWTIERYTEVVTEDTWRAFLLEGGPRRMVAGRLRTFVARDLGAGMLEVSKEPLDCPAMGTTACAERPCPPDVGDDCTIPCDCDGGGDDCDPSQRNIRETNRRIDRIADLERALAAERERRTVPVVCICGSTRFKQAWIAENARLTGEGNIVLAVGLWGHHERKYPDAETKAMLDELHKRKIDLCDWVWILDIGGYIGDSTRSEIEYAEKLGRPVRYLSREFPEYVEPVDPLEAARERWGKLRAWVNGRIYEPHRDRPTSCFHGTIDPFLLLAEMDRIEGNDETTR